MGKPFRHGLRVRYKECDPQGIVFNGNYLHYFDIGVTELYREAIGGWSEIQAQGVDAVVAEANLRYLRPLHFDERFEIALCLRRGRRRGEGDYPGAGSLCAGALRSEGLSSSSQRSICAPTSPSSGTSTRSAVLTFSIVEIPSG